MWIKINTASVSKKRIATGEAVGLTIKFKGQAAEDGIEVNVIFSIDSDLPLKINGKKSDSEKYIFGKESATYSMAATIQNDNSPASKKWLNGSIALDGKALETNVKNSTDVGIQYK